MTHSRDGRAFPNSGMRAPARHLALAVSAGLLAGCGFPAADGPGEDQSVTEPTIEEVQEKYTPEWMDLPGVVGTGIGLCETEEGADEPNEPCIRVFLSAPSPEAEEAIPRRIEGYRVDLVVTGRFRPH